MKQQYDERNRDLVVGIDDTLVHRDQAGISPFDSVVQGGDAVWEGLRLHGGRIFKLTEHLARLRRSAQALAFTTVPVRRGDHRADPRRARRQRDDRRRAHPADPDPRREDHQRHGPAAQPVRPDADRAGRVQVAGLRRQRHLAGHVVGAPAPAGLAGPEDPPQQPAHLDPGEGRGQRRRRRRRADARRQRVRGRDQRDARLLRLRRRRADVHHPRLPRGHHPRDHPRDLLGGRASRSRSATSP